MNAATKEAIKILLLINIRVMRSDLEFGSYSPEIKNVIKDKLNEAIDKYNNL